MIYMFAINMLYVHIIRILSVIDYLHVPITIDDRIYSIINAITQVSR